MSYSKILDLGDLSIGCTHQRTDFIHLGEKLDGSFSKSTLEFQLPESLQKCFPHPTTRLPIFLPMNNIEDFFPQYWEWSPATGEGKPYRFCVGEGDGCGGMRLDKKDWKFKDFNCPGWNCPDAVAKNRCKRTGILSIYVDLGPEEQLNLYQIKTRSGHTLKTINAQVEGFKKIPFLRADISFVPLWLSRLEKTVTDGEGNRRKIHYLSLSLRLTAGQALDMRGRVCGLASETPTVTITPPPDKKPEKKTSAKEKPPEAAGDGNKDQGTDFSQVTDLHQKIYRYADKLKKLNSMYGSKWLTTQCGKLGGGAVEEITDIKSLEELLAVVEKRGFEMAAGQKQKEEAK